MTDLNDILSQNECFCHLIFILNSLDVFFFCMRATIHVFNEQSMNRFVQRYFNALMLIT